MPSKRNWTDAALEAAVKASTTHLMVLKRLGLSGRGGSHYNIKKRITELGLDTSHFTSAPNNFSRPWTADQLARVVAATKSYAGVISALGLDPANGIENKVRRHIKALGLSTAHFSRRHNRGKARWSEQDLRTAVAASRSYSQVIRALGLIPAGGNYNQVQRRIRELSLDVSHFTGAGWSAGLKLPGHARPLSEVLVQGSAIGSHALKLRLFAAGLKKPECELCGWAGIRECDGQTPVELDHANGDKTDNRIENLRVLCPNCHALQPTHRGLNRKSKRSVAPVGFEPTL